MEIQKLVPEYKEIIWGGSKLKEKYGKQTDKAPLAETWELAFHRDGKSRLSTGEALADVATERELGKNGTDFPFFPTLVKLIDAKDDLSVQVHPSDDYALANENSFGKTEMWYIVEAEEGAGIYLGFNRDVTKEEYERVIAEKRLTELLNFYEVKAGDCYFIPSGTIHAIGKGCLICEIQQNSNLTYRVYDYGRKGKDGKERELHVEKALKVTSLSRYEPSVLKVETADGTALGLSKYFTTTGIFVSGQRDLFADEKSFRSITCVSGAGYIQNEKIQAGDTFFVPAGYGKFKMKGEMKIIMVQIRKYYVGIDIGGTFIKGGIVDDQGTILCSDKVPTGVDGGSDGVSANIASLVEKLLAQCGLSASDVEGIGMGVPGMIDSANGVVVYSNNLRWRDFELGKKVKELTGLPVKIANDANVAALGETKFGSGKDYQSVIFLTLGTGVGGGIVIDGKLIEGNRGAGAELGHIVIQADGEACSCGRKGCFEAYASATALIRDTKRAMEAHKDSKMWEIGSLDKVNGQTAWDYKDVDVYAKEIVENYIKMLGEGITNYANVFRPDAVALGGGVCAQGDNLILPLQKYVAEHIYAGKVGPQVEVVKATLENQAGLVGGAALLME